MPNLLRAEIWSELDAAGGVRLALLPNLLSLSETVSLEGEHTVAFSLPADDPAHITPETPAGQHNFQGNKVVRLVYAQRFTGNSFSEHRIATSLVRVSGGARTREVTARSILSDLAFRGLVMRTDGLGQRTANFEALSLLPREHIEFFVIPALEEAGQGFWDWGHIDSDKPIDVTYDRDTPLSALRKIATAAGNLELEVTAPTNGVYLIRLWTQIGGGTPPIVARAKKNLVSLGFTESSEDQATRIYAFGTAQDDQRPTIGLGEWCQVSGGFRIESGQLWWVKVVDPGGGPGPLVIAGQFASGYALQWITEAFTTPILATNHLTGEFLLDFSTAGGVGPGDPEDRFRIVRSDGTSAVFVDHPAMVAEYGVRVGTLDRSDIPATTNLVPNPFARVWGSGALPDSWGSAGATVTKTTDPLHWQTAGQAIVVAFTGAAGMVWAPVATLPLAARGYLTFKVRLFAVSGILRVRLVVQVGESGTLPPILPGSIDLGGLYMVPDNVIVVNADGSTGPLPPVVTTQTGIWQEIGIAAAYDLGGFPLNGGFAHIEVFPDPTTPAAAGFIDAAQLTVSADQQPWLEGNGGVKLHQAANERLLVYATPSTPIDVSMLDLETADGEMFPNDQIILGAPLTVLDPEGRVGVTTRILGWSRDWMNRLPVSIKVSDDRQDVMQVLTRRGMTARHGAAA